jgi:hypothetical protein
MIPMQDFFSGFYIFEFVFLALCVAALEIQFQEYMGRNMIFDWWRTIVHKMSESNKFLIRKMSYPLGMCRYCNGFWLSVIFYVVYYYDGFDIFQMLLFTSVNFIWIVILSRLEIN